MKNIVFKKSAPQLIKNFLNKAEIHQLSQMVLSMINSEIWQSREHWIYTCRSDVSVWHNWELNEELKSILQSKLESFLNYRIEKPGGHFFIANEPYPIHSDGQTDGGRKSAKTALLCLDIEGTEEASIVFFDQYCFTGRKRFMKSRKKSLPSTNNVRKSYYPIIVDYEEELDHLSNQTLDGVPDILSHLHPEDLEGLSVQVELKHQPGDLILFDSYQLHTSGSFEHDKIRSKKGLSLFTYA